MYFAHGIDKTRRLQGKLSEMKKVVGNGGGGQFVNVMFEIAIGNVDGKEIVAGGNGSVSGEDEVRLEGVKVDLAGVVDFLIEFDAQESGVSFVEMIFFDIIESEFF